jgi:GWxTD domain-containing protein
MTFNQRVVIACLSAAIIAGSAFGQLSVQFSEWGRGPAQWLMTEEESAKWKTLRTDAEAQAFVDLFWARRDPTPATPVNEFRQEFEERVKFADEQFTQARKKGSMTDRGQIYIVLGRPYKIQRTTPATQQPNTLSPGTQRELGTSQTEPKQLWIYEQAQTRINLGQATAQVAFVDQYGTNDWTLERTGRTNIAELLNRGRQSYVVSPNLTEAPQIATTATPQPQPQQLPTAATPPATDTLAAFKTESLKMAIAEYKAAKADPFKDKRVGITYTELLTPAGDYFVPVQLYIPKAANLTADAVTTFFGLIEDKEGNTVAIFEEPARLSSSKGDLYFDRAVMLKPGSYRATLGLAGTDGKPAVIAAAPMELKDLNKDTTAVSRLILATDLHEMEQAAPPGAAYAFGKLKVVPKGDRVFTNKDEITYFIELINPGIDETTNAPKIQVKLDMVPPASSGRKPIGAPIAEASPLPLSGTPGRGQYAIIASIPLGNMTNPLPPGEYTFRVKVFDQVAKQNFTAEQKLQLVAAQ